MPSRIEDYALIGDTHTAALVGKDGAIDWLCLPRFDSDACFAALLGDDSAGTWRISPTEDVIRAERRYRGDTLVLETDLTTASGTIRIVDAMFPLPNEHVLLRLVEGVSGKVEVRSDMALRFDYGRIVPWVRRIDDAVVAIAGPNAVALRTTAPTEGHDLHTYSDFTVDAGDSVPFSLHWYRSHRPLPDAVDVRATIDRTEAWWAEWMAGCTYDGLYQDAVRRSLVTLKALTYAPTGGILAAATTSLPEQLGGVRNWDYRYCWLRDATITLIGMLDGGFVEEAAAWREWLLRAIAGDASKLQIMYGVAGERRLTEYEVPWLPGYEGAAPVRVGNAAVEQFQLDVYGEVMDALYVARTAGGAAADDDAWSLQRKLMDFLESAWKEPDEGIWEVRGPRRHFVHSKVMAWVAFDRAVKGVRNSHLPGPVGRWEAVREQIREEVLTKGWDSDRKTFTQFYGSKELDASLLYMPLVGFLPGDDSRMLGTVAAIERELLQDGFVARYSTSSSGDVDGLPLGEGAFLACTFWLADNYALCGRVDEARALFERLLALRNDVGLLAEEWDPKAGRMTGNFPQAFSHVPMINTARTLTTALRGDEAHHSREHGPRRSKRAVAARAPRSDADTADE